MEVLDIVQSAAFKAGIVPSFNVDEFPGDVQDAGRNALINEILPSLNCDRTIDITETSRYYTPVNGRIVLTPLSQPTNKLVIVGRYDAPWEYVFNHMLNILENTFGVQTTPWPTDDLNNYIKYGVWSSDNRLVWTTYGEIDVMPANINIDFPPMRIDGVIEMNSRVPLQYVYRDEYERTFNSASVPGIYTTEEQGNTVTILMKGSPAPKCIILPVPLQIINVSPEHSGTIVAPEKFRRYLIDCTAVSLAIVYGVSTLPAMQQQAAMSYNLLKKNKPQPLHQADPAIEINNKLRRSPLGRRFYANL